MRNSAEKILSDKTAFHPLFLVACQFLKERKKKGQRYHPEI